MITDIDPSSLSAFTVKPLTTLSDHSQITVYLKRTETNTTTPPQPSKLFNINKSYRWAENSTDEYQKAIGNPEIQTLLDTFLDNTYVHSKEGINIAVEHINHIFMQTAKKSQLKQAKNKPKNPKDDNWFDKECKEIRQKLRMLSNQKHREPGNIDVRLLYCDTLKQYKRTLRIKKTQYTQKQLTLIEESIKTNRFWKQWNNLKKSKSAELAIQNGDIWVNHFETLFQHPPSDPDPIQNQIITKLNELESAIKDNQNPLDSPITEQELKEKVCVLKPNKASGLDGIMNEMLKCTTPKFKLAILKLFNLILSVGYFPDIWNHGLITPIF